MYLHCNYESTGCQGLKISFGEERLNLPIYSSFSSAGKEKRACPEPVEGPVLSMWFGKLTMLGSRLNHTNGISITYTVRPEPVEG